VEAFAGGDLATRLATIELLGDWHAPLTGIDPWQPETVTDARLNQLRHWAARITSPPPLPTTLPATALVDARQEIARMLRASAPPEIRSCRERLARLGPALMDEVLAQIKAADTQSAIERLTALRYRLVASPALALSGPLLFDRLASADINVRHKALDELAKRVRKDDKNLLLELFSDRDELMREIALRTLQSLGGDASDALVRLLNDPMPNVRAAVLKQLAENPNASLIPRVVQYVASEKDADLVVHAVRVLRAAKQEAGIDCLLSLLNHESWRVRAESIEALQECFERSRSETRISKAVAERLDDPDGYVVSRAIAVLGSSNIANLVQPLTRAVERHPEMAAEIIQSLCTDEKAAAVISPTLRKFAGHENALIRAAAIAGLCRMHTVGIDAEVLSGLRDGASAVRMAAAGGLFEVMERLRPSVEGGIVTRRSLLTMRERRVAATAALPLWLERFRSGDRREIWMNKCVPELLKMLSAPEVPERMAAALPLVGFAQEQQALPVLLAAAKSSPSYCETIARALPWLPAADRVKFFKTILELKPEDEQLYQIAELMAVIPDEPSAGALWDLLGATADLQLTATIENGLHAIYQQPDFEFSRPRVPDARIISQLKERTHTGSEMQRVVALMLLGRFSPADSAEAAAAVYTDPGTPPAVRLDALPSCCTASGRSTAGRPRFPPSPPTNPARPASRFSFWDRAAARSGPCATTRCR